MWANDTNYTVIKNGVVVVSGTGPAIRVAGNQLVIRDGPKETPTLTLSRAEAASGALRHIIVTGEAGGFVTFPALEWLRDTGVALSHLDRRGGVIFASGPRGPDQPALRRAQVLASMPGAETGLAVLREIIKAKLRGQSEVARLLGHDDVSATIGRLAKAVTSELDGTRILSHEAQAAFAYWRAFEGLPITFARQRPSGFDRRGRWVERVTLPDHWHTFGQRASMLTGRPFRATTPGNACLNYLYAVLEIEMTIALHAVGLDPGIGVFHLDADRRASLALDAIEAVRPYVDCWLAVWLTQSAFACRDFHEGRDGEVRMTRELAAHLAMTAALWRAPCQAVAAWLAQSFGKAARLQYVPTIDGRAIPVPQATPPALAKQGRSLPPLGFTELEAPLPAFLGPARGYGLTTRRLRGGLKDNPVPRTCFECGRAIDPTRRDGRFCSATCLGIYRAEMRKLLPVDTMGPLPAALATTKASEELRKRRLTRSAAARWGWERAHLVEGPAKDDSRTAAQRAGLQSWYDTEMRPRLSGLRTIDVSRTLDISRVYARKVVRGEQMPHPRHFAALAKLAGVEVPSVAAGTSWGL